MFCEFRNTVISDTQNQYKIITSKLFRKTQNKVIFAIFEYMEYIAY